MKRRYGFISLVLAFMSITVNSLGAVPGQSPSVEPGYELFRVRPQMGTLDHARATVSTVRGEINVSVKKDNKRFSVNITVPENTKCEVYLPAMYAKILCNGKPVKAKKQQDYNAVIVGPGTFQFDAK